TGTPFLGWPTTQGRVLFLIFQDARSAVRVHFRRLGRPDAPIALFIGQAPAQVIERVRATVDDGDPFRLIVVDMLAQVLNVKDTNDYAQVTKAFDPILSLSRETGAALLLLHHGSVHSQREGLDAVLASTAISGSVDNVMLLKRTGSLRSLSTVQRIGPDLE